MTLLTPPFALGAAGQVLSGRLLRHSLSALVLPGAGVTARSGILYGPPGTVGELALPTALQLTVQPFHAVVQNTQDLTAGAYMVTNDAAVTLAVTAQHATQFRRSLVVIEVNDSQTAGVASSATTDRARLYLLDGALGATAGAAALPATPANGLALGEVLIPPTGQTVTLTPYNPRTAVRGGQLPLASEAARLALAAGDLFDGLTVVELDTGRTYRRIAGAWQYVGGGTAPRFKLAFGVGWQAYTQPPYTEGTGFGVPSYWKDASGVVSVAGLVTAIAGASYQIGVLPVGFRPRNTEMFLLQVGNSGLARVDTLPDGQILMQGTAPTLNQYYSLNAIQFHTQNTYA